MIGTEAGYEEEQGLDDGTVSPVSRVLRGESLEQVARDVVRSRQQQQPSQSQQQLAAPVHVQLIAPLAPHRRCVLHLREHIQNAFSEN